MTNDKIQLATRRNILDGFLITRISWSGKLEQQSFLGRLYDLSKLPSYDSRYKTADEDIHKHTVMNDDWPTEWVFTDARFNVLHSTDKVFLDFLCLTLHPTVRQSDIEITTLLEIYTNNLKRDGYTIEKSGEIAGRPLFTAIQLSAVKTTTTTTTIKPVVRKALVIGCSKYQFANPLVNPLNDANGVEAILQKLGFEVTKKIDPSQKELKITIDEFGDKLKGSDIGLFYFAGHGVQVKGLNYLIPVDANLSSEKIVEYDCVEAGRILAHMEDARTEVNIMILDACRNNPFERSWGRGIALRGLATMNAPKG
jgi:AbiJ N-terminal domain 3/Caspase domain